MRPWDRIDQGPPFWSGDLLGLTTADGRSPFSRGCKPCAIAFAGRNRCAVGKNRASFPSATATHHADTDFAPCLY